MMELNAEEQNTHEAGQESAAVPQEQEPPSGAPCVRTRVAIDAALLRRISKTSRPVILFMMILGIVMLVVYIVFSVIAEEGIILLSDDFWLDILLWGGAVFFAFGLVLLITCARTNKKQLAHAFVNEYEFYPEGLVINDYRSGEHVSTARLRYSDFEKIRENKEFFLLYPNRVTIYPVDKMILSEEECALLRTYFRLPARQKKK